jgi:hypothetical protein
MAQEFHVVRFMDFAQSILPCTVVPRFHQNSASMISQHVGFDMISSANLGAVHMQVPLTINNVPGYFNGTYKLEA